MPLPFDFREIRRCKLSSYSWEFSLDSESLLCYQMGTLDNWVLRTPRSSAAFFVSGHRKPEAAASAAKGANACPLQPASLHPTRSPPPPQLRGNGRAPALDCATAPHQREGAAE